MVLLALTLGTLYVWRQGTVSALVRELPQLLGRYGIPTGFLTEHVLPLLPGEAQPLLPPEAASPAVPELPPPPAFEPWAWSVQLGSYRHQPQALAARDRLLAAGFAEAFVVQLELDSLGLWNRLYLGAYRSPEAADTALAAARPLLDRIGPEVPLPGEAILRLTPLTLRLGDYPEGDSLTAVRRQLEESLLTSYLVPLPPGPDGTPLFRLYAGAFEDERQALLMAGQVHDLGVWAEIVEREGPVRPEPEPPAAAEGGQ